MQENIEKLYTEDIKISIAAKFNVKDTELIGDVENYVYVCRQGDTKRILRITHEQRRIRDHLAIELDFISYLVDNNLSCGKPLPSKYGNLIEEEKAEDGSVFFGCLFDFAQGKIGYETEWTDELLYTWGRMQGRINRLSRSYISPVNLKRRPIWHEEVYYHPSLYLPQSERILTDIIEKKIDAIKSIPETEKDFGLIHSDLHQANFFWDDSCKKFTAIDFDDMVYGYYAGDIGTILFYASGRFRDNESARINFVKRYMKHFVDGYKKECDLSDFWIGKTGDFIDLRMIVTLVFFYVKFNEEKRQTDDRIIKSVNSLKEKIINSTPYIDYNFL